MWPVSPAFLDAVRSPTTNAVRQITTSTGHVLKALSGKVDMDGQRTIQRTCDIEFIPTPTLSTDQIYALLMSPTIEIYVYRGLLIDGAPEMVPLGVFSTDNVDYSGPGTSTVSWHGSDRGKKISRARLTDAYQITAGTTLADAGSAFLRNRWQAMPCDFTNVLEVVQADVVFDAGAESDPWDLARKLFTDHGYDLFVDGAGVCRAKVVPDPATVPADFDFGGTTVRQLLTDAKIRGSFDTTYNGVIVTSDSIDDQPPVRGEAWDDDPSSPTYYLGGMGRVPYFQNSGFLTTVEACEKAARTILARVKGRKEQLSFESIVMPALTPFDVVTAQVNSRSARRVLDQLTVPLLAAESMPGTTREVNIT